MLAGLRERQNVACRLLNKAYTHCTYCRPTYFSERELTFPFPAVSRPSVVCLSVTLVVHPTQPAEILGNVLYAISYLGHPLTSTENFTEIVPGARRVAKYSDFWTYRRLYLGNGARYEVS